MTRSTPNITRRRFLAQAAAATGAAALPAAVRTGSARATARTRAQGVGTTTFMNWDPIEGTPIEAVIQAYQQQTGSAVEVIPTPGRGTEYETKVRTMLAGGTVPDIMRVNDDFVRYYSIKDQILDLTPYIERDGIDRAQYFEGMWDFAAQPDGRYTAWSIGSQPRLVFYNVDMFNQAGVPLPPKDWTAEGWTWDDFLETARKLTVEGERWGALVYDDTGYEQTFSVNNGEETGIYDPEGRTFTLANPPGVEAVQWVSDLTCVHKVQPERGLVTQPDSGNNLFTQGRVAMIFRTQSTADYFRRNASGFAWDVAPPPARADQKTEPSLIVFAITKAAKNPDAAWELLKFMGGAEGSRMFAEAGSWIPGFRESAALIKPGTEGAAVNPANIGLFATAMEHLTTVNFTEATENARNIYRPQLDLVYTCEASAEEVLTQARPEVEEVLSGAF
ncbi:MAG: sugar ABC transporter substrate-binding protein [Chloroflexota bacterium]|nr:sugar ABC transporter substrate-binding protein [Chloroflexota bacterium]